MDSENMEVSVPVIESETVTVEASTPSDEPVEQDGAEGDTGEAEAA